jgi:hypothetical protein
MTINDSNDRVQMTCGSFITCTQVIVKKGGCELLSLDNRLANRLSNEQAPAGIGLLVSSFNLFGEVPCPDPQAAVLLVKAEARGSFHAQKQLESQKCCVLAT